MSSPCRIASHSLPSHCHLYLSAFIIRSHGPQPGGVPTNPGTETSQMSLRATPSCSVHSSHQASANLWYFVHFVSAEVPFFPTHPQKAISTRILFFSRSAESDGGGFSVVIVTAFSLGFRCHAINRFLWAASVVTELGFLAAHFFYSLPNGFSIRLFKTIGISVFYCNRKKTKQNDFNQTE